MLASSRRARAKRETTFNRLPVGACFFKRRDKYATKRGRGRLYEHTSHTFRKAGATTAEHFVSGEKQRISKTTRVAVRACPWPTLHRRGVDPLVKASRYRKTRATIRRANRVYRSG